MQSEGERSQYHPELISRRGELTAWTLAILTTGAWIFLAIGDHRIFWGIPVLAVLLLLSALSISLGNWMDRQSVITVDPAGIKFTNGVRHAELGWHQIQQVKVYKHRWGDKVHVVGERSHFSFRKLGEVTARGQVKGRMGFADGEYILQTVLKSAGLREIEHDQEYYYYAR